jgi:hypothetical protein
MIRPLAIAALLGLATGHAQAWSPPAGQCLLSNADQAAVAAIASRTMAIDVRPEQIAVDCRALEAMRAQGGTPAALRGRALIFGRPLMAQLMPSDLLPADIDSFADALARNLPTGLAQAWPSVPAEERAEWSREMAAGRGAALAEALARRAMQDPPRGIYGILLSRASGEIRVLFEDPAQRARMVVRIHLHEGRMVWTIALLPGLPTPGPISEGLRLLDAAARPAP